LNEFRRSKQDDLSEPRNGYFYELIRLCEGDRMMPAGGE
jgi:hypothetical protein